MINYVQDTIALTQDTSENLSKSMMTQTDSLEMRYERTLYSNHVVLADTIFSALKSKKFEDLKQFIVSANVLKDEFDTLDLKYLNRLANVKSEYAVRTIQKQHIKMLKECKLYRFNLRTMEGLDRKVRVKEHSDGHEFAEIVYYCKSGKRRFYLTFLELKIMNHWFLADELTVREL